MKKMIFAILILSLAAFAVEKEQEAQDVSRKPASVSKPSKKKEVSGPKEEDEEVYEEINGYGSWFSF